MISADILKLFPYFFSGKLATAKKHFRPIHNRALKYYNLVYYNIYDIEMKLLDKHFTYQADVIASCASYFKTLSSQVVKLFNSYRTFMFPMISIEQTCRYLGSAIPLFRQAIL